MLPGKMSGEMDELVFVAEIGQNHNGNLSTAMEMINAAASAGATAVKFQKRVPALAVPEAQRDTPKDTPWGTMSYLKYRECLEFSKADYDIIDSYCRVMVHIPWFVSVWDIPSAELMLQYANPYVKIPSAKSTDLALLRYVAANHGSHQIVLSTGMSTLEEIDHAVKVLQGEDPIVLHCTSTYPCPLDEINLQVIPELAVRYPFRIGYSGHESGLAPTIGAVALGARFIERHFTLDRTMWGSDQAASVEPEGFRRLVRMCTTVANSMGDGNKEIMPGEVEPRKRLRGEVDATKERA